MLWREIGHNNEDLVLFAGKIGDWRNTFTEDQICFFDTVYSQQMQGCPLTFLWECPEEEEE